MDSVKRRKDIGWLVAPLASDIIALIVVIGFILQWSSKVTVPSLDFGMGVIIYCILLLGGITISHLVVILIGSLAAKLLENYKIVSKTGYLIAGAVAGLFVDIFIFAVLLLVHSSTYNSIIILIASATIGMLDFFTYWYIAVRKSNDKAIIIE